MKEFFFDTANLEYIKKTTEKLDGKIDFQLIKGITTNPNAFNKINENNLERWLEIAENLGQFLFDLRGDNKGEVHIQLPNSEIEIDLAIKFADYISQLSGDRMTVGMKIPPKLQILEKIDILKEMVLTNVTGVSDPSTALKCITFNVDYVSLIPGRMEEVGIDAKRLMAFLFTSNHGNTKIISGSMRTIEQLIWTFQLNTVPTIGEKVFDLMFENDNLNKLINIDYDFDFDVEDFSPNIDEKSIKLSTDFFDQMNELGLTAYKEFRNNNK
tara:strand:- start:4818 stop:5627 length:810 start_codon:yes stop_codon:yes gene_type:complete